MVISIEGSHRSIRNSSTVSSVEGATGTSEQLVETASQNELVVDEYENAAKLRIDRDFGFLTLLKIGAKELHEIAADQFFLVRRHRADARPRRVGGL
jgi:hypothetical protein